MRIQRSTLLLTSIIGFAVSTSAGVVDGAELQARFRRPMALQLALNEQQLYVANARSGSLSIVDVSSGTVSREIDLGERLSDMKLMPDGQRLLITDENRHELLVVDVAGDTVSVAQRVKVAPYPVSVTVDADGQLAIVASLWSRRLTFIELPSLAEGAANTTTVDLPFAPRCQLLVNQDSRLVVADAFGSKLGIVDTLNRRLLHVRSFPSHNIRGLAISPNGRMLLVIHQMLNELAHTTNNDVHWGLLMSNDLRWLPLDSILSRDADLYRNAHMHPLGHAGNATGDPSGIAVTAEGTVVVSLGGVGEVAIGTENDFSLHRIGVGRRPTAVVASRDGLHAFVANTFDDSISIVDLKSRDAAQQVSLGPKPDLTLSDRGELLFYDASLSHDGWMSCHSCHTDGHSNSLLNDNFSDDSFGAPKRVLSLLGIADTAPFAWNAHAATLEQQIRSSITNTMQGEEPPTDRQVAALESFLRTLSLPPPLDVARGTRDPQAIARGEQLFQAQRCFQCHVPPTYTTPKTYDVGIYDKQGNKEFNPPSLRGLSQRGPFFHDNRAETLEAVFTDVGHQLDRELSPNELRDLVAFLNSL